MASSPAESNVGGVGVPGRSSAAGKYIAGRLYDWVFFILSPLWALLLGIFVRSARLDEVVLVEPDDSGTLHRIALVALLSATFTHAHLAIVFFRTHLNRRVFERHPHRFTTIPVALFFGSLASQWIFVVASVLTVWWDVYHSSLQTFGLGRIYDRRAGNDPHAGRRADYIFNLVVYVGPVVAGVNLGRHIHSFEKFDSVDIAFLSSFGRAVLRRSNDVRRVVVPLGLSFLTVYLAHYLRLMRRGYSVPPPKLVLYVVTAFVSIACWGFGSFGEAFLVMNFFHALQYFAIVWWSERQTIMDFFACPKYIAFTVLVAFGLGYGYFRAHRPEDYLPFIAFGNVVSLMHFWYDGFVWSVRKGDV